MSEQEKQENKNNVTIEDAGPCKKKVSIEIPEEKVKAVTDEQYSTLRQQAEIPGFRKGRAPRRLLEKRFGKEATEQIKLRLLAEASDEAIKDNELDVLREPDINHEEIELPESGPLKFDFEVEVKPDFELPSLENIPVTKTKTEVTDEQLDQEINQLRKYAGVWTPKGEDETVEEGDQVIADATVKLEDEEEPEKLDNTEISVRKNGFVSSVPVENLNELLEGKKAGEKVETTVEIPKTYYKEEYRGKKADIEIKIKDIKYLKPADIDESFLERFGVESEEDLRERFSEMLKNRKEQQARQQMSEQIYEYMRENTDFELPTDIVAEQANSMLQRQYAQLIQQGLSKEELQEKLEDLKASSEEQAAQQLKTFFIMDKVADQFNIEVTDEEVNGQIARLAMQQGQRPEQMRDQMEQNGTLSQFKLRIREEKCISKLLENADITEKAPDDEDEKDESEDDSGKGKGKKKKKKTGKKKKKKQKKTKKSTKKKKKKKSKKKSSE